MSELNNNNNNKYAAVFWKEAADGAINLRDGEICREWDLILDESDILRSFFWPNTLCTTLDNVFDEDGFRNIIIPGVATRNFKNALDYFSHVIEYVGAIHTQYNLMLHIELSPIDEGLEAFLGERPNANWERIIIHYSYFDDAEMDVEVISNTLVLNLPCDGDGLARAMRVYEHRMTPRRELLVPDPSVRQNTDVRRHTKTIAERSEVMFEKKLERAHWRFERYARKRGRVYCGPSFTIEKVRKAAVARFRSDFTFGPIDRTVTSPPYFLPFARQRWPYQRELIFALQFALDNVCWAPYVILEIYDWLPQAKYFTHKQKIQFINDVRVSINRVRRISANMSVADRVKRRSLEKEKEKLK